MMNTLEQLKTMTTVVADTGDINAIKQYAPTDATTNPSLIYAAAKMPEYKELVDDAVAYGIKNGKTNAEKVEKTLDKLSVNFGVEILKIVPRYVSTEVDARLSFDTEKTIEKARQLIALYAEAGVEKERILIKIASTWEGIQAAKVLEQEGVRCNLTLLFDFTQAAACAQAGIYLISPFVGRIFDWYKKAEGVDGYAPAEDPGVKSVSRIYSFYRKYGYKTLIMGASFRNKEEIKALAGCDLLTVGPKFLQELQEENTTLNQVLTQAYAEQNCKDANVVLDEKTFRWLLNENAMATEKLAEGIRNFSADLVQLEKVIEARIQA